MSGRDTGREMWFFGLRRLVVVRAFKYRTLEPKGQGKQAFDVLSAAGFFLG